MEMACLRIILLEGNQSDKGGSINLDNTDNFESSEGKNNSEQFHNRVLDIDPSSILSNLRKINPNKLIIRSINKFSGGKI